LACSTSNALSESWTATYTVSLQSTNPAFRLRVAASAGWHEDFVHSNGWWFVDRGDGALAEAWQGIEDELGHILTNQYQIFDIYGLPIFAQSATYTLLEGTGARAPSTRTTGLGAEALTNRWFYRTDLPTNHINYGKLAMVVHDRGAWERYEYDATTGRRTKTIACFGNAATNAAESACRVFEYDYTPFHPMDDGSVQPDSPRLTYETLKGTLVSLQGLALWLSNRVDVRFHPDNVATLDYDDPNNLLTATLDFALPNGRGTKTIAKPMGSSLNIQQCGEDQWKHLAGRAPQIDPIGPCLHPITLLPSTQALKC